MGAAIRTEYENAIIFALPVNAANLEKMQRLGVAIYEPGLTAAQRARVLDGTVPIGTVLRSVESGNFQTPYSTSPDRSTKDWYIGCPRMTSAHWARLQAYIATLPAGYRYVRCLMNADNDTFTVMETNIAAASGWVGRVFDSEKQMLARAGLKQWRPAGAP